MTFGERIKQLRQELGFSQEALGAQGFISTPGWIKIENGQRQASEKLIHNLVTWLVGDKHLRSGAAGTLREELLTLKYLGSNSTFLRSMAKVHAKTLPSGDAVLAEDTSAYKAKPRRGRPAGQEAPGQSGSQVGTRQSRAGWASSRPCRASCPAHSALVSQRHESDASLGSGSLTRPGKTRRVLKTPFFGVRRGRVAA